MLKAATCLLLATLLTLHLPLAPHRSAVQQGATYYSFRSKVPNIACTPVKTSGSPSMPPPPSGSPVAKHCTGDTDDGALASPTPRTPNDERTLRKQPSTRIVIALPTSGALPLHIATVGDVGSTTVVRHTAKSMKLSPRKPFFAEVGGRCECCRHAKASKCCQLGCKVSFAARCSSC
jgi:hypothetical protein